MNGTSITSIAIVFTGGGSAGHVTPNLALIAKCREQGWDVFYIGSKHGLEKLVINKIGVPYFAITTAGLRRYASWRNLLMPLQVLAGIVMAFFYLQKIKPQVVFSKGGFVALPVVVAAWLKQIPVIAHESDYTPGLANRLCLPFVKKLCITFADTKKFFSANQQTKIIYTGTPIRHELFQGDAAKGRALCGFTTEKPILLVQGGGLGATDINNLIRELLPQLLQDWQVVHLCGESKVATKNAATGYKQFAYLHAEFADVMAAADLIISRAGANSIYELLALKKLAILLPLTKASRGDQIANAAYCVTQRVCKMLATEDLTKKTLLATIQEVMENRDQYLAKLAQLKLPNATDIIYQMLQELGCNQ